MDRLLFLFLLSSGGSTPPKAFSKRNERNKNMTTRNIMKLREVSSLMTQATDLLEEVLGSDGDDRNISIVEDVYSSLQENQQTISEIC